MHAGETQSCSFLNIEEEPEPQAATLTVCTDGDNIIPTYSVTGNNPSPSQFTLMSGECQDVTIGPGMYLIVGPNTFPELSGDCSRDPNDIDNAVGEIQSGETQSCTFTYLVFG